MCIRDRNKVKTFTEKPNLELAKAFLRSGEFFWNSGIFVWQTRTILESMNRMLPETCQLFASIEGDYGLSLIHIYTDIRQTASEIVPHTGRRHPCGKIEFPSPVLRIRLHQFAEIAVTLSAYDEASRYAGSRRNPDLSLIHI